MAGVSLIRAEPGRVWRVVLSRPGARNAVSEPMLAELLETLRDAATDPHVRVILLTGDGPAFSAGADLGELDGAAGGPGGVRYEASLEEVIRAITDHPVPVVAAVHGAALGAGCQIAVACDLAVAAADAKIGIPSSRLGIVINFENVQRLVLSVGPRRAAEILLTGRAISGRQAADWGLVNEAVPPGSLLERAEALAEVVASNAPLSVRGSKRGIRAVLQNLSVDRETEGHLIADFDMMAAQAFASEDLREGLRAFRERRSPDFRGK
jgi:enoyl-CoA hydratase